MNCPFDVGDCVWIKPVGVRCDQRYGKGMVTSVVSDVAVEVDGMPRHIRDLRPAVSPPEERSTEQSKEDEWDIFDCALLFDHAETTLPPEDPVPRRSDRVTNVPDRYGVVSW